MPRWWEYLRDALAERLMRTRMGVAHGGVFIVKEVGSMHTEPQPPQDVAESRDLKHCHPELVRRYLAMKAEYERTTGRCLVETCTWRSKGRQFDIFKEGRELRGTEWVVVDKRKVKTKLDGFKRKSRHNVYPSQAVDVAVDRDPGPGKHIDWSEAAFEAFATLAPKHGLIWGGDWNRNGSSKDESFVDMPHFELPADAA